MVAFCFTLFLFTTPPKPAVTTPKTVWDLVSIPENEVNLGEWALVLAKIFDPKMDSDHYRKRIDQWAEMIQSALPDNPTDMEIVSVMSQAIYEKGPWNGETPFGYDLEDPEGDQFERRFLPYYMDHRLGNCVTMPLFYLVLAERVAPDFPIHGAAAPSHLFCRFKDRQTGKMVNIETTNGKPARDVWLIEQLDVPQAGIDSGIFFREMTKKEFLGELIVDLGRLARELEHWDLALEYMHLSLKLYPFSVNAMVQIAALLHTKAYHLELQVSGEKRALSDVEVAQHTQWAEEGNAWFEKARSLGWSPESVAQAKAYQNTIEAEKGRRKMEKQHP